MTDAIRSTALHVAQDIKIEEPCVCSDLIVRIQAIWNVFLAIVESIFSWCGEKIHGVGSPAEKPEGSLPLNPPPKPSVPRGWIDLSEWFAAEFDAGAGLENLNGEMVRCPVDVVHRPAHEALVKIQNYIDRKHLLHFVSNSLYTKKSSNSVEQMLKLGAVANSQTEDGFTPLHCAVLSRCFLAYRTLREHGADPMLETTKPFTGDGLSARTPLEQAYKMKKITEWTQVGFFESYVQGQQRSCLAKLFPSEVRANPRSWRDPEGPRNLGKAEDIDQIIAYEEANDKSAEDQIMSTLDQLISHRVLALVVNYLQIPADWKTK